MLELIDVMVCVLVNCVICPFKPYISLFKKGKVTHSTKVSFSLELEECTISRLLKMHGPLSRTQENFEVLRFLPQVSKYFSFERIFS